MNGLCPTEGPATALTNRLRVLVTSPSEHTVRDPKDAAAFGITIDYLASICTVMQPGTQLNFPKQHWARIHGGAQGAQLIEDACKAANLERYDRVYRLVAEFNAGREAKEIRIDEQLLKIKQEVELEKAILKLAPRKTVEARQDAADAVRHGTTRSYMTVITQQLLRPVPPESSADPKKLPTPREFFNQIYGDEKVTELILQACEKEVPHRIALIDEQINNINSARDQASRNAEVGRLWDLFSIITTASKYSP